MRYSGYIVPESVGYVRVIGMSKFFHRIASGRKRRNQIDDILDEFGIEHGEEKGIQKQRVI
ncbi:hypothetical protein ACS0TY_010198 [Phlomoides rotata]